MYEPKERDTRDKLVIMWRAASYNHDVVGEAIDLMDRLQAENQRLQEALQRLGSMEAFDISRAVDPDKDKELIARINFANAALEDE